ncbi:hypothetical protein [Saccharothrix coeruleofusca]|uniref:Uncharacterized protein n=1 Tax=Saccharothrix coeruleofusca TaxID=33919 RepID=A0A918AJB4_9PSEU|nr:hypothetical protein [Saccharothrix coeruleofusca]GGP44717.1 hypothetical protein GCM10010185_15560 [Saccharothrix coeruleofusca]
MASVVWINSYEKFVAELVAQERPGLFAVLREYGERDDAEVAAWGLAWPDHVEVVLSGGARLRSSSTERVASLVGRGRNCGVRIVWVGEEPTG